MTGTGAMDRVLDQAIDAADGKERFAVGDLLTAFGRRGHGPLILLVGLMQLTPLAAIPGANDVLATIQLVLALHYAFSSGAPWLPAWLRRRNVEAGRVRGALGSIKPYAHKVQFLFRERVGWLTEPPWSLGAALVLAALAVSMYAVSFVPGAVAAPGLLTALIAIAVIARDGLMLTLLSALTFGLMAAGMAYAL